MVWTRAIVAKVLLIALDYDELDWQTDTIVREWYGRINDAADGSMHVSTAREVPEDDIEDWIHRAHFFVTHPAQFELPFILKYPRERVNPACPACHGTGDYDPKGTQGGC